MYLHISNYGQISPMIDYLNIDHNTVEPHIIMVGRFLVGTIE